jgi:glycosyltransferase involved in cell wall biosynthesis
MTTRALCVTVPTRNRPTQLRRCLEALARARASLDFTVCVCDSSAGPGRREAVMAVCEDYSFVELHFHDGSTRAAARNVCTEVAGSELIVTVDDDVYVEPDAIELLLAAYRQGSGPRVVAGSLKIGERWTGPRAMRQIGYGRPVRPGEKPSFVLTGLLLYPRELALMWPWSERMPDKEDVFMSVLWRRHGVDLMYEPMARATHEGVPANSLSGQDSHIYVRLFDTVVAAPAPRRAIAHELLGFAAGMKLYGRTPRGAVDFLRAWGRGHRAFIRDYRELRALCAAPAPGGHLPPDEDAVAAELSAADLAAVDSHDPADGALSRTP